MTCFTNKNMKGAQVDKINGSNGYAVVKGMADRSREI